MKTEKMSFASIKKSLSREEMKKIMAGSGGCGSCVDGQSNHFGCYYDPTNRYCRCPSSGYSCN